MQYTQDYDEYYPKGLQTMNTTTDAPQGAPLTVFTNLWWWAQLIYPYAKSTQVFVCPSGLSVYSKDVSSGHYGANTFAADTVTTGVLAMQGAKAISLPAVPAPSTVYMLMDAGVYSISFDRAIYAQVPNTSPLIGGNQYLPGVGDGGATTCATASAVGQQNDCQSGRHFGGVNVVFADGHVKWLDTSKLYAEAKKTYLPSSACVAAGNCNSIHQWCLESFQFLLDFSYP